MQGWRKRMEDSHISDMEKGSLGKLHVFGVFDGHGGKEVAQYVKAHFTEELLLNPNLKNGNIKMSNTVKNIIIALNHHLFKICL